MNPPVNASVWVERFGASVPKGGTVCDVACGSGRHTRWFAAHGHDVLAIDRDLSGVADLTGDPHVELIETDLEIGAPFPVAPRSCSAVVVTNYLWRPILGAIADTVAPGGVLLYETFAMGNERLGKPTNPGFLLRRNELLELALEHDLAVVAFEDLEVDHPRRAVVQRIAAVRAPARAA
jgi:SAM-dependent methyltransferase